jgi:hypothetical protein
MGCPVRFSYRVERDLCEAVQSGNVSWKVVFNDVRNDESIWYLDGSRRFGILIERMSSGQLWANGEHIHIEAVSFEYPASTLALASYIPTGCI